MTAPIVTEREVVVAAPRETVWLRVTDTDRLNRLAGMDPVEFSPLEGAGAARLQGRFAILGFRLAYEERPFEWAYAERFSVERIVRRGPLERIALTFRFSDAPGGGTRVALRLELTPRGRLIRPAVRMAGPMILRGLVKAIGIAVRRETDPGHLTPSGEYGLERVRERLAAAGVADDLADALVDHVRTAPDPEADRIRPYELADRWDRPRREVLESSLAAVRAGLLELSWDLVCPSCRTSAARSESLATLEPEGHCHLCDIRIGVALDRSVEATFRPAPAIRRIPQLTYCVGGPARVPHVVAQQAIAPGEEVTLAVPNRPGRYRVFLRGGATAAVLVEPEAPASAAATATAEAGDDAAAATIAPAELRVAPGGELALSYAGPDERHVKLERRDWASAAATAHDVSLLPQFRDQFSDQLLVGGVSLRVGRVALLFSDLTGSTQLYTDVGDAAAFHLVQRHFDVLRGPIEEAGGVIVKTIGDAIMAAFEDEAAAMRAAVAMLEAFPPFARESGHPHVTLKLGIYEGACYAVTANGLLDYFGQTVNVAARLQGQAGGGELVVTAALAERAEAEGWLGGATVTARYDAQLKGVAAPVQAARIVFE